MELVFAKILIGALCLCCCADGENVISFLIKPKEYKIPLKNFKNDDMGISLSCYDDGSYLLSVGGKPWLKSAPTFFNIDGQMYSMEDATLKLQKITENTGTDQLGAWESIEYWYSAGDVMVQTSFKGYASLSGVIFEQSFPDGARNTSVHNKDQLISGFPGFMIDGNIVDLGCLSYGYIFVGDMGKKIGRWAAGNFTIKDGRNSGPMALFDKTGNNALFISPFDQFMTASAWHQQRQARYYWGIMGSVAEIERKFTFRSIVYYGAGINDAISGWGSVLRRYYNKLDHYRKSDFTNNYLSYWSDNGAYYVNYYVKGGLIENMTYEEAMLHVKQYADAHHIPYSNTYYVGHCLWTAYNAIQDFGSEGLCYTGAALYLAGSVQYSVWFKQGKYGGNGLWSASKLLFPHGMKYMFQKTGLMATAHSRYWSPDTPYAKVNGGRYNFFVEKKYALPYEEQFWTDMFAESQQFGFKTYMQDWLNKQFDEMEVTTNNTHVARTWLIQMGEGARRNDMTIQYCMSESRHILQSLEIPVVTQARASDDYQPNDPVQWRIGISSMFAHAVGLTPFKDTFWTTTKQPHNYYHGTEPYPTLHVTIATLSTGPVGPGDMINHTDVNLLMRCCDAGGLILKPSRPALAVDAQLIQTAFGGNLGPQGEVWTTYSDIGSWRFGIIFATDMHNVFSIGPTAAHFGEQFPKSKIYTSDPSLVPKPFTDKEPIVINNNCTKSNVCLFYTTPVFTFGGEELLLLGELSKIVPVSPQRILSIQWDTTDFTVNIRGAATERITLTYILAGHRSEVTCIMSEAGTGVLSIRDNHC